MRKNSKNIPYLELRFLASEHAKKFTPFHKLLCIIRIIELLLVIRIKDVEFQLNFRMRGIHT